MKNGTNSRDVKLKSLKRQQGHIARMLSQQLGTQTRHEMRLANEDIRREITGSARFRTRTR